MTSSPHSGLSDDIATIHRSLQYGLKPLNDESRAALARIEEQFEAAQEAIRRIADDVHLVLNDHYSGRTEERIPALPAYARLTVIVEEDEDRIRDVPGVIAAALDPVAAGYYPGAFIEAVNASSPAISPRECPYCDGRGWNTVAVHDPTDPDGEPLPKQEQCATCGGSGEVVAPAKQPS